MASDEKPWEDESLKGEYNKEKERQRKLRMKPPPKPKPTPTPTATEAWAQAEELAKRNKWIAKRTKPLRKLASGTEE